MMTLSKQRKFTFNSLLENIRESKCCVIKVRQYTCIGLAYFWGAEFSIHFFFFFGFRWSGGLLLNCTIFVSLKSTVISKTRYATCY